MLRTTGMSRVDLAPTGTARHETGPAWDLSLRTHDCQSLSKFGTQAPGRGGRLAPWVEFQSFEGKKVPEIRCLVIYTEMTPLPCTLKLGLVL